MTVVDDYSPDWENFRKQLSELETFLVPFIVPPSEEVERYELSVLTYGRIESSFKHKLDSGEWIYATDPERRMLLETISWELGFIDAPLTHRPQFFHPPRKVDWDFIRSSIAEGILSLEFVQAWGQLMHLAGRYIELVHNSRRIADEVGQAAAGKLDNSSIVQKHWYARWVQRHSDSLSPRARNGAENQLASICRRIYEGELHRPLPYPREWFGKLLDFEGDTPSAVLKVSYTRLSVAQLEDLLRNPLVTPEALPPLSERDFKTN